MTEEVKFCYHCGANLPVGSVYCPECGAMIDINNEAPRAEYTATPVDKVKKDVLGPVPTMIIIYGIVAIIGAIFTILLGLSIDALMDMLKQLVDQGQISQEDYDAFWDALHAFGSLSVQLVFTLIGLILVTSGILALVAGTSASKLKNWNRSVICCGVAALLPVFMLPFDFIMAFLLPIVGLIMTYQIYKHKADFES